jgi:predicted  nucleic acid-binding Zn-ribbon protein
MKKKIALVLTTVAVLLSFLLAGCQSGIPQELYDQLGAQLNTAKEQLAAMQDETQDIQAEKETVADGFEAAQAAVAELEGQINELLEQYELVGATKAETAENIVRNYHETHVYSTWDMFICSDMSSEVWNMLKAEGINAKIVVGNKDAAIGDILLSDHAWVHAEIAPGEYLALETTGGYVVTESENPLYYKGWSFDSPADLKANNDLIKEYNVRVEIRNQIAVEVNEVLNEHNEATNQTTADKFKAVYDKLMELKDGQEIELNKIKTEIDSLATKCGT